MAEEPYYSMKHFDHKGFTPQRYKSQRISASSICSLVTSKLFQQGSWEFSMAMVRQKL